MSEVQLHYLIFGIVLPVVVSGGVYVAARLTPTFLRQVLRPAGAALALALALFFLVQLPSWPLVGSPAGLWLPLLCIMFWPLFEHFFPRTLWFKRFVLFVVLTWFIVEPLMTIWRPFHSAYAILLSAAVATFVWSLADQAGRHMRTCGVLSVWGVMGAGYGALMFMQGSAALGELCGTYGVICGVAVLLSLFQWLKPEGGMNTFAVIALLCHAFYVDGAWPQMLWLLSPLLWFALRSVVRIYPRYAWREVLVSTVVAAIPVGWVGWQAWRAYSAGGGY